MTFNEILPCGALGSRFRACSAFLERASYDVSYAQARHRPPRRQRRSAAAGLRQRSRPKKAVLNKGDNAVDAHLQPCSC